MLVQIHHQSKKDRSEHEMKAQKDIFNHEELLEFTEDIKASHPLPDKDTDWLICNEDSEFFWWAGD